MRRVVSQHASGTARFGLPLECRGSRLPSILGWRYSVYLLSPMHFLMAGSRLCHHDLAGRLYYSMALLFRYSVGGRGFIMGRILLILT